MGNCVTGAIPSFLATSSEFNEQYEIVSVKPVFMIKTAQDIEEFKNSVSQCDVLVTQPISGEKYKEMGIDTVGIKNILKPQARFFAVPTPYFIGYFPEQFYLHDANGNLVGECEGLPAPYHNKIILYGYINKMSSQETYDMLYRDKCYENPEKILKETIAELQNREKSTTFAISDFIIQNFRKQRLFWTINHPTNALIFYISEQIANVLSKDDNQKYIIKNIEKEFLNGWVTPILPSIEKNLQLEITNSWDNRKYTIDFIKATYDYYDRHPELVSLNKRVVDNI